jgi:hypothetical protein
LGAELFPTSTSLPRIRTHGPNLNKVSPELEVTENFGENLV